MARWWVAPGPSGSPLVGAPQVWVEGLEHVSPGEVRGQVQGQLKALKTDYLDLCLLPALSDGAAFQVGACSCWF